MSLALPTFAIFPENEEKDWDEDSVLSWSDTPRRHGTTDEATSAPCERQCGFATHSVLSHATMAVVHKALQLPDNPDIHFMLADACMHMWPSSTRRAA